jgi:hypothetical protein
MPCTRALAFLALLSLATHPAIAEIAPPEEQIVGAVSPAPEHMRDGATVLGYDAEGRLVTLREGEGDLICLADDPSDERFHVACYYTTLEPFMARGRELRAEGVERSDVRRIRGEEIAAGKLEMPPGPTALYSLTGELGSFDAEASVVRNGNRVYSVYIPYATAESTGLPTEPITDGGPWLMSAGEPWAHIMVVQPSDPPAEEPDEGEG